MDYQLSSVSLYDGGWRSSDRDELKLEYDLSDDEVDRICEILDILDDAGC